MIRSLYLGLILVMWLGTSGSIGYWLWIGKAEPLVGLPSALFALSLAGIYGHQLFPLKD